MERLVDEIRAKGESEASLLAEIDANMLEFEQLENRLEEARASEHNAQQRLNKTKQENADAKNEVIKLEWRLQDA